MIQIEVKRIFVSKLVKNGGSLYAVIPKFIVEDYDDGFLKAKDKIELAYIKRVKK